MLLRLCDVIACLILLLLLAIPMLGIAVAIWLGDGRPILFRQSRVGQSGQIFTILKFRTMYNANDNTRSGDATSKDAKAARAQFQTTQVNDPRITPIGRVLRKTHLDELPQVFNVLRGDMSLVGVRPDTPVQQADYTPDYWQARHTYRPGITGLAQVYNTSLDGMKGRQHWETIWNQDRSFTLYLKILWATVGKVTRRNSF